MEFMPVDPRGKITRQSETPLQNNLASRQTFVRYIWDHAEGGTDFSWFYTELTMKEQSALQTTACIVKIIHSLLV